MSSDNGSLNPLESATHAFVDGIKAAANKEPRMISRKQIASTLDIAPSTLANWLNKYGHPNLERVHGSDLSVNKRLYDLEELCGVASGTLVALYRAVVLARREPASLAPVCDLRSYEGITCVHRSFPASQFSEHLAGAARVRMLNTWYPSLRGLEPAIREALNLGCRMEVAVLNPYCTAAIARASTLGYPLGSEPTFSINGQIQESLRELAELARQSDTPQNLGIFAYPELPAFAVYQADDYMLAGFFLHGRRAVDGPWLEISSPSSFMAMVVSAELQRVRESCIGPIPPDDPEEWINGHL